MRILSVSSLRSERTLPLATLITCGVLCLLAALWFMGRLPEIRREIRPVYIELGIIPQAAIESQGR